MNSIRIKKLGKILIGSILLILPYFVGKISLMFLLDNSYSSISGIPAYIVGLGISIILFFVIWGLGSIILWFLDDTRTKEYW